jgi:hypothetical protein
MIVCCDAPFRVLFFVQHIQERLMILDKLLDKVSNNSKLNQKGKNRNKEQI